MSMPKQVQAKHVPQDKILAALKAKRGVWHLHRERAAGPMPSLLDSVPELRDFPEKVVRRALGAMARRGEIQGCDCGCRGDWHVL